MIKGDISNNQRAKTLYSFIRTFDILNRYLVLELAKHDSTPIRFAVTNALFIHGGKMTPATISHWIFRSNHSVTQILDQLEKQGLVARELNKKDRRSIIAKLTKKGWNYLNTMIPISEEMNLRAVSCLNDEEIETLNKALRQFRKHLLTLISS